MDLQNKESLGMPDLVKRCRGVQRRFMVLKLHVEVQASGCESELCVYMGY